MTTEPTEGRDRDEASFEANLERFKAKMAGIPEEYHKPLGWLYVYRQIQDQRKRLVNRATQLSAGKKVFWGSVLPPEIKAPMALSMTVAADAIEKAEDTANNELNRSLKKTSWYREVAIPAARGIGISETGGMLSAAKILDAYGSPSRFETFGQLIRYSRLAPENGKAPKRTSGARIKYNPKAWQALFDLSESWNKMPDCVWRQKWDAWKLYYREKYPDEKTHPQGRIHNMARRKVMREFLHDLWDLWIDWEHRNRVPQPELVCV